MNEEELRKLMQSGFEKLRPHIEGMTVAMMECYQQGFKDCWKVLTGKVFLIMKELSIEEKAKAYDEALEKAKSKIKNDKDHVLYEDDRIRKEITDFICWATDRGSITSEQREKSNDWLAWLEKQGEHKKFRDSIQVGDKVTRNEDGVLVNLSQLNRVAKKDEKQSEQKSIKVPKFKVGDFIQFKGIGHTRYTVKEVCGLSHYINTCNKRMDMSYTDANFELVEQKPEENPIISLKDFQEAFELKAKQYEIELPNRGYDIYAMCKELYSLLIKQKPAWIWSEKDETNLNDAINACKAQYGNMSYTADWLKSLKDRVQPKQEWSEEDERTLDKIIVFVSGYADKRVNEYWCNWLKSLRPQNHWKPSDEMLEALYRVIPKDMMEKSEDEMLLDKLYQGLKYGRVLSNK